MNDILRDRELRDLIDCVGFAYDLLDLDGDVLVEDFSDLHTHQRILRVLDHAHVALRDAAVILVGDACEEIPRGLYDAAARLPPIFLFQEGDIPEVEPVFCEIARLTCGAYCRFNSGAARQLAELLRCVAAFAAGGRKALSDLNTTNARLLLSQVTRHA
jgi:hypothetical protein